MGSEAGWTCRRYQHFRETQAQRLHFQHWISALHLNYKRGNVQLQACSGHNTLRYSSGEKHRQVIHRQNKVTGKHVAVSQCSLEADSSERWLAESSNRECSIGGEMEEPGLAIYWCPVRGLKLFQVKTRCSRADMHGLCNTVLPSANNGENERLCEWVSG